MKFNKKNEMEEKLSNLQSEIQTLDEQYQADMASYHMR